MKSANLFVVATLALAACGDATENVENPSEASTANSTPQETSPVSQSPDDQENRQGDNARYDRDMAYYFSQGERGPALSFGVPRTDNIALNLRCPPGAMGQTVLVSFNRPAGIVAQRPDTVTLTAGNAEQQLAIETRETQLGTTVEVATDPQSPAMKAYREGAALSVSYGDETIVIPSRSSDTEIDEFFGACNA